MGIIRQQTIKGSVISYIGAILGLVNTVLLYPRILLQEEIGLVNWLLAISAIVSQFSTLGFNSVTSRLFPYFRNERKSHHGFLFLLFVVGLIGFFLALLLFLVLKPYGVRLYQHEIPVYMEFLFLVLPLVFFGLYFNLLDGYNRVMYDAVSGTFFRDIVFKLLVLGLLILFSMNIIDFENFLHLYVVAYSLPTILLFFLLWKRSHISLRPELKFIGRDLRKSMMSVSFYGILNGISNQIIFQIDRIMIVSIAGFAANGVFTTMANFGVLVSMPSRTLERIASTVIAESWKRKDLDTIQYIYYQSTLHQFVLGALIFVCLWVNIDNICHILPVNYHYGQYVVLFVGLANVINMLGGVGSVVIINSPYYRVQSLLLIFLGVLVFITNYLFIPLMGITGAAFASFLSLVIVRSLQFLFLSIRCRLQPFNKKYIWVVFILVMSYLTGLFLPNLKNLFLDVFIRSALVCVVYIVLILVVKVSPVINEQAYSFWSDRIKPFF